MSTNGRDERRVVEEMREQFEAERQRETDARYYDLWRILRLAYEHAASGKGEVRHGAGRDFGNQPICTGALRYGRAAHCAQIEKKLDEALRLPPEQAIAELYGVINYAAAAVLALEAEIVAADAARRERAAEEQEAQPNKAC